MLPIAAIEQHGPHLAVSTDTIIGQGMVDTVIARLPDDLSVLFLPVQAVGKSNEHMRSPGTITYTAETALRVWTEIGESVARAGLRKLIIVTSHGGNVDVMRIVARELRVKCQMLVVTTGWRFGLPKGLYSRPGSAARHPCGRHGDLADAALPARPGAHGEGREFRAVVGADGERVQVPAPDRPARACAGSRRTSTPPARPATPRSRTAEKGKQTAEFQAERFIELLRDVERFELSRLA